MLEYDEDYFNSLRLQKIQRSSLIPSSIMPRVREVEGEVNAGSEQVHAHRVHIADEHVQPVELREAGSESQEDLRDRRQRFGFRPTIEESEGT
jgi:hypothetical protein